MARSARKKSKADDESTTYQILQYLARVAVWGYFRNVKVITRVPISKQGPLLVAANHMNMVLDPAVLIATFPHNRPCHFWALKRFFKIPLAGKILKAAGVLPVDTKTRSNAKLFEHTFDCLENGGVVALFPEGTSYTAPQHLPFKNGISWAAFEYLTHQFEKENNSPCSIPIIPVGITYTTKNKWRSDVIVEYGEPINVTSKDLKDFQVDPKLAVKSLTNRIALGVEKGTINSPDWDTYYAAAEARYLLFGDKHNVRLEDYVHVSQSLIEIFHPSRIEDKTDPKWEERAYLKTRLLTFSKTLRQLHLTAKDISMYENREITMKRAIFRLASTWTALAIQLPLFLPGVIINWPIYLLGRLAERFEKYTESVAQDKLVLSVVVAIPLYGTIFYQLWKMMEFSLLGSVIALVTIPILAWYHMALVDKRYDMAKEVVASWRICIALTSSISGFNATPRRELEDAVQLQRWCRVNTKSLLLDLSKSGDIHARYLVQIGKSFIE